MAEKKVKYRVDEKKRKRFPAPMFTVKYIVNAEEVEKYRKRHRRLPNHVYEVKEAQK